MANVKLENLTKRFGNNIVVNRVDIEIPDGTLVSVLGPSGCGKTTMLRMIAGFETPDEGNIYFDQERVTDVPPNKRDIGMVFQSYALFPHMTVAENVAYGLQQRKLGKEQIATRVRQVLETVHMSDYAKRKPKQLSGGQQQRVALARALVVSPKLLLLDECLSALDKKLRVEMQAELRKILEESKITTFFVTHDQEEAMTLSDFVLVMDRGVIEQMGTPLEVYEKPRNQFVAGFLGKANFFRRPDGAGYAVRPEKIRLSVQKKPETRGQGEISFVSYSGNMTSYALQCEGRTILAERQNTIGGNEFQRGQTVFLNWDNESEIALEE